MNLLPLIARLEAATGPSNALNRDIAEAVGWKEGVVVREAAYRQQWGGHRWIDPAARKTDLGEPCPAFTDSLDAATSLIPATYRRTIQQSPHGDGISVHIWDPHRSIGMADLGNGWDANRSDGQEALAIATAALRARQAKFDDTAAAAQHPPLAPSEPPRRRTEPVEVRVAPPSSARLPVLAIVFDGVIHSFTSGWIGSGEIPDPPVAGAIDFIRACLPHFEVAIFGPRAAQGGGNAMRKWLDKWAGNGLSGLVSWPAQQPPAMVTIDVDAVRFSGCSPSPEFLALLEPWMPLKVAKGTSS